MSAGSIAQQGTVDTVARASAAAAAVNGAAVQAAFNNATASSSTTTYKMAGVAASITPIKTGRIHVVFAGYMTDTGGAAGSGVDLQASYGTGTAPVGNAALAGTQIGTIIAVESASLTSEAQPFTVSVIITGLTLATTYWLDLAVKAITQAGATIVGAVSVIEF